MSCNAITVPMHTPTHTSTFNYIWITSTLQRTQLKKHNPNFQSIIWIFGSIFHSLVDGWRMLLRGMQRAEESCLYKRTYQQFGRLNSPEM